MIILVTLKIFLCDNICDIDDFVGGNIGDNVVDTEDFLEVFLSASIFNTNKEPSMRKTKSPHYGT